MRWLRKSYDLKINQTLLLVLKGFCGGDMFLGKVKAFHSHANKKQSTLKICSEVFPGSLYRVDVLLRTFETLIHGDDSDLSYTQILK